MIRWLIYKVFLFGLLGCSGVNSPAQPAVHLWTDHQTALSRLSRRAESIRTTTAQCDMTLRRHGGDEVRLEGVLIYETPDRVRLRAWKLQQAVFDLTSTADGVWLMQRVADQGRDSEQSVHQVGEGLVQLAPLLAGRFFLYQDLKVQDDGGPHFEVTRTQANQAITCVVDRESLTAVLYQHTLEGESIPRTLRLQRYRMIDGIPWPTRLLAEMGDYQITLSFRDVRVNTPMMPRAFKPPRGADKLL